MSVLSLENVAYSYRGSKEQVLQKVNSRFKAGKFYAIVGQSGGGKSTLLSLMAGLDSPNEGQIKFDERDISLDGYAKHRKKQVCLIFQNYNLIDYLTPLENVRLVNKKASANLLLSLGLNEGQITRNVLQLSGGQQQRVAIARALAAEAPIILADEPTGNLDPKTAADIIAILREAVDKHGKCVIVVTHSKEVAASADEIWELKNHTLHLSNKSR